VSPVARERNAPLPVEAPEQHLHLERREVLDFVDGDVPVAQGTPAPPAQRANAELPGAKEKGVVLRVEFGLDRVVSGLPREHLLAIAPVPVREAADLRGREHTRRLARADLFQQGLPGEHAGPVIHCLLPPRRPLDLPNVLLEGDTQRRVQLQALHLGGRVAPGRRGEGREVPAALRRRPVAVGEDAHPLDPQRRKHVADVVPQRRREDCEECPLRGDARCVEGQVGDAVKGDGRLSGPRGSTNHQETGRRLRDQIELVGVDQARDLRQVLVGSTARTEQITPQARRGVLAGPPLDLAGDGVGTQGRGLAAGQPRPRRLEAPPPAGRVGLGAEQALRCLDAPQCGVADQQRTPRDHLSGTHAPGELLLVLVTLLVAVEDPRHRCVSPVDDSRIPFHARGAAEAEISLGLALAQAQMGEVG
jgi:hypothetical protein